MDVEGGERLMCTEQHEDVVLVWLIKTYKWTRDAQIFSICWEVGLVLFVLAFVLGIWFPLSIKLEGDIEAILQQKTFLHVDTIEQDPGTAIMMQHGLFMRRVDPVYWLILHQCLDTHTCAFYVDGPTGEIVGIPFLYGNNSHVERWLTAVQIIKVYGLCRITSMVGQYLVTLLYPTMEPVLILPADLHTGVQFIFNVSHTTECVCNFHLGIFQEMIFFKDRAQNSTTIMKDVTITEKKMQGVWTFLDVAEETKRIEYPASFIVTYSTLDDVQKKKQVDGLLGACIYYCLMDGDTR